MKTSLSVSLFVLLSLSVFGQSAAPNAASADFAQRYRAANQGIFARVVFLGDSIFDYWGSRSGTWFPYPGWVNRGIGGQTTAQLLLRERSDALALHPKAIVLEGGSNDMRMGFSPEEIRDNFLSMGELAQAHGIAVFVATMTPVCDCFRQLSGLRTVERIHELNILLASMCKEHHWTLIDWNPALSEPDGHMRRELTTDGVHPNDAGYALLAPILEQSLRRFR